VQFLVRDRDTKFTATFDNVFASIGAETILTPVRAPTANAFAERWVRTVREDGVDHVLVFSRRHLEMILGEYVAHYNRGRPHRGLDLTPPRPTRAASSAGTVHRRDLSAGSSTSTSWLPDSSLSPVLGSTATGCAAFYKRKTQNQHVAENAPRSRSEGASLGGVRMARVRAESIVGPFTVVTLTQLGAFALSWTAPAGATMQHHFSAVAIPAEARSRPASSPAARATWSPRACLYANIFQQCDNCLAVPEFQPTFEARPARVVELRDDTRIRGWDAGDVSSRQPRRLGKIDQRDNVGPTPLAAARERE